MKQIKMKQYKYIGFLEAFFLLTADEIRSARHYQLKTITDEKGNVKMVDDINKCGSLLS